jgi:amidase
MGPVGALPPAGAIAAAVRAGAIPPADAVRAALERIADFDGELGAFATVRREHALREAELLADRDDLPRLPLAGVPVAVKDTVPVRGVAPWTDPADPPSAHADHPMVTRLRAAGAVVVGTTTASDASLWPTTDGRASDGRLVVTRNPWNRDRTAGGSSGGAAAAVAAGLVPVAQGTDSLGSVRMPAAACGVVGVKPGAGVVTPVVVDPRTGLATAAGDWFGLSVHGAMGTTVEDAALLLSVMAGRPALAEVPEPPRRLRVAVGVRPPVPGVRTGSAEVRAVFELAGVLRRAGYEVARVELRFPLQVSVGVLARWAGAAAGDVDAMPRDRRADPQPRTLRHAAVGARARHWIGEDEADLLRSAAERALAGYDVLLTPSLAKPPPRALAWSRRSWAANVASSLRYTGGLAAPWNLAGWPAISVPAGHDEAAGVPVGAQLVGRSGDEPLLFAIASLVERLRPWPRVATRKIRR